MSSYAETRDTGASNASKVPTHWAYDSGSKQFLLYSQLPGESTREQLSSLSGLATAKQVDDWLDKCTRQSGRWVEREVNKPVWKPSLGQQMKQLQDTEESAITRGAKAAEANAKLQELTQN
jgi:hypothetical protein